jgi:hypothetical protein
VLAVVEVVVEGVHQAGDTPTAKVPMKFAGSSWVHLVLAFAEVAASTVVEENGM